MAGRLEEREGLRERRRPSLAGQAARWPTECSRCALLAGEHSDESAAFHRWESRLSRLGSHVGRMRLEQTLYDHNPHCHSHCHRDHHHKNRNDLDESKENRSWKECDCRVYGDEPPVADGFATLKPRRRRPTHDTCLQGIPCARRTLDSSCVMWFEHHHHHRHRLACF